MRKPEDVFTPRAIVSREMFERRNEPDLRGNPGLQDSLLDALRDRGAQVLLYGDTGVGKSSLIDIAADDEKLGKVTVECFSSDSFDSLIDKALKQLVTVREISRTRSKDGSGELSGTGGLSSFLNVKGTITRGWFRKSEFEVVQQPPIDALIAAMKANKKQLVVFDNFQNIVSQDDRRLVAQAMELMADRASTGINARIVVIGIAADADKLLAGSGSYTRRTVQIGVPRMPDEEVREIITRGFRLLSITVDPDVVEQVVFFSDGFPYFAHLLGLSLARTARRSSTPLDAAHVEDALERAAKEVNASYAERVQRALELSGEVRPREQILRLLADSDQRTWLGKDVQTAWEDHFNDGRSDFSFLYSALGALATEKYGAILTRTGPNKSFRYQFTDPQLRPYLRIAFRDRRGV